jgi:hypothetical protein
MYIWLILNIAVQADVRPVRLHQAGTGVVTQVGGQHIVTQMADVFGPLQGKTTSTRWSRLPLHQVGAAEIDLLPPLFWK